MHEKKILKFMKYTNNIQLPKISSQNDREKQMDDIASHSYQDKRGEGDIIFL